MNMVQVKVSELTGAALDWAVAECEGGSTMYWEGAVQWRGPDGAWSRESYSPSTDWAQGGPIIARKRIDLLHCQNASTRYETLAQLRECADITSNLIAQGWGRHGDGPNRDLIAAMRCYVASVKGETVTVPAELVGGAS